MSYKLRKIGDSEVYYHALYHLVAHWAAYAAMMVALVTVGVVVSATSGLHFIGLRFAGAAGGVIVGLVGALYFINGMSTFGAAIREALPDDYRIKIEHFPHETTISFGRIAAILVALADLALVWWI